MRGVRACVCVLMIDLYLIDLSYLTIMENAYAIERHSSFLLDLIKYYVMLCCVQLSNGSLRY